MKYVIVTMRLGKDNRRIYPAPYDPVEVDRNKVGPLIYEHKANGETDTDELLCCLNDATADKYAAANGMRIVTKAQANTWLTNNAHFQASWPSERVNDPNRMAAISAKLLAKAGGISGVALSASDKNALNPKHAEPGVVEQAKNVDGVFK